MNNILPTLLEEFHDKLSEVKKSTLRHASFPEAENLIKVAIVKGTVAHEQHGKFGGALVFLKPAAHGTGVIAGGAMRAVLESVGVTDVLAKSKGSSNPHNVVKATMDALMQMRDASAIAQQRGISMEKVFNG